MSENSFISTGPLRYISYFFLIISFFPLSQSFSQTISPPLKLVRYNHSIQKGFERICIIFNTPPEYNFFSFTGPERLVIEFDQCIFTPLQESRVIGSPLVNQIRVYQNPSLKTRLVIDKARDFEFKIEILPSETSSGHRLLIDMKNGTVIPKTEKKQVQNLSSFDLPQVSGLPAFDTKAFGEDLGDSDEEGKLALDVEIWNETAYRIGDPHGFSKIKSGMDLSLARNFSSFFSLFVSGKGSFDAVFNATDHFSEEVKDDQEFELKIREAYVDSGMGDLEVRLGWQQIVWGQAVGLFIADLVNPKDLREYILPDLDEIRIPVLAANLEYYHNQSYVQFIFIPFPEFNEFGEPGSEFDFSLMANSPGADIIQMKPEEPAHSIKNVEWGVRGTQLIRGWDLGVFFMYDFDNFPISYRNIETPSPGSPPTIRFTPKYQRLKRAGFSFSKDMDGLIIKGESVYSKGKHLSVADDTDLDGITEKDTLDYLIGIDYTFFDRIDTNFQFMQTLIFDHENRIIQDDVSNSVSFWMSFSLFNDKIEPELFFVTSLDREDYLVRPKLIFNVNPNLSFTIGIDLFEGDPDGAFGLFDDNDRVYMTIYYTH